MAVKTEEINFLSVNDIKKAHKMQGGHWFDADTRRFFGSRFSQTMYGGRFFVSSELFPSGRRLYSVRVVRNPDIEIGTVGEFGGYDTLAQAQSAARAAARRFKETGAITPEG